MAFADKLVAIRRAHNLTQEGLAAKLYVTRQAVSRWVFSANRLFTPE